MLLQCQKKETLSLKKCLATTFGILGGGFVGWGVMLNPATVESAQALLINRQTSFAVSDQSGYTSVIYDWSYDDAAASDSVISLFELENWSWSLVSDGVEEQGKIVTDGVVTLALTDVEFEFDLDQNLFDVHDTGVMSDSPFAATLRSRRSDPLSVSSGELLVPLILGPEFSLSQDFTLLSETTIGGPEPNPNPPTPGQEGGSRSGGSAAVSTPEPNLMLGFITLGGLILGSKKKTKG